MLSWIEHEQLLITLGPDFNDRPILWSFFTGTFRLVISVGVTVHIFVSPYNQEMSISDIVQSINFMNSIHIRQIVYVFQTGMHKNEEVIVTQKRADFGLVIIDTAQNQLLQRCTARTTWSESDQSVRTVHSCNTWWLALLWSDSVIKLVSVLFGKCATLVVTKCWPIVIRQPCGDQWKAEKLGAFWRWPITRCLIKSDSS